MMETGEVIVFWVCGALAVIGAVGMLISRKAVHSALFVALTMVNLAVLYIANSAPFLGMVQIIVYTGAVMMLFLFVLMVVGVDSSDSLIETLRGQRWSAILMAVGFAILLTSGIGSGLANALSVGLDEANSVDGGNVPGIARLIFTDYLIAFEMTSALLITAGMGAMILAHREHLRPPKTQRQLSEERTRLGAGAAPLPSPGVYARHNSVDTPALLPDGSPTMLSVPEPVRGRGDVRPIDVESVGEVEDLSRGASAVGPGDLRAKEGE